MPRNPNIPRGVPSGPHLDDTRLGAIRPRFSGYDVLRFDDNVKAKATRIVSPYMSFRTERYAMRTFRGMISILVKRGFVHTLDYDGPDLGITHGRDELVPMDKVMEALDRADEDDIPFGGLKMVLVNDGNPRVKVKVRVKEGRSTKVKLKVKGTLTKAAWNQIRADVKRKFHVKV